MNGWKTNKSVCCFVCLWYEVGTSILNECHWQSNTDILAFKPFLVKWDEKNNEYIYIWLVGWQISVQCLRISWKYKVFDMQTVWAWFGLRTHTRNWSMHSSKMMVPTLYGTLWIPQECFISVSLLVKATTNSARIYAIIAAHEGMI